MELWLDTINFTLIENAHQQLTITGVTTNPSILSQAKDSPSKTIQQLLDIQPGFVAVQVTADTEQAMLDQAERLNQLSERIIIKVPVNQVGLRVIKQLSEKKIPTLATAIFETSQVYLSMLAGAQYAAPYLGRIEDVVPDISDVINSMLSGIKIRNSSLKLMAAAIKSKQHILNCLLQGVHAITLPEPAYKELMEDHSLTLKSLASFQKDWATYSKKDIGELFCN